MRKLDSLILKSFIGPFFVTFFVNANSDLDKLNIPDGFHISIFADNLESPRQIAETDNGYVIAGSKKGNEIYERKLYYNLN